MDHCSTLQLKRSHSKLAVNNNKIYIIRKISTAVASTSIIILESLNKTERHNSAGDLPRRSNLTCFEAVSASVRSRLSICLDRSVATLSSLLDKQPMLKCRRSELFHSYSSTQRPLSITVMSHGFLFQLSSKM